jgi:hypothetical protein
MVRFVMNSTVWRRNFNENRHTKSIFLRCALKIVQIPNLTNNSTLHTRNLEIRKFLQETQKLFFSKITTRACNFGFNVIVLNLSFRFFLNFTFENYEKNPESSSMFLKIDLSSFGYYLK